MTIEQRRQALDFSKIRGTGMPVPSGHTSISERAHILNLYYESYVPPPVYFWRNRNLISGLWTSKTNPSSSWKSKNSPSSAWKEKTIPQDGNTQVL